MAYMVGIDGASGRATASPPKKTNPSSSGRPGPRMPDEEVQRDRQAYIQRVYGGPVSNRPEVQKALSNQYDYNKKRITQGKAPLAIADVRWNPAAYDDAMNEWMDQRYQKTGKLPSGEERLDYFRDEAANKRRAAFESPQKPTEYQPIPGGLSALKESGESPAQEAAQPEQSQQDQPLRHSAIDPLSIAGGMSQLAGNDTSGQPTAYEQARALGMQTGPTKTSDMATAKEQDSGRSAWVDALDRFLPKSILPEAPLPAQEDIPAWMPKWALQAADAAEVLNRALPSNLVTNYLLGTLPTAIKSAYLNSVAAGVNAVAGKPVEFTPDMTMADYTAQESGKLNVADPLAEANRISPWLGIPASILAEGLSDPTTFVGLGELQALGRGGTTAKMGTVAYEDALKAGRLTPKTEPAALDRFRADARAEAIQKEKAKATQLADEAKMVSPETAAKSDATSVVADDVLKEYTESVSDTVTYRRVQGGTGDNASRQRISVNPDGSISITRKGSNLSVSIDNGEHSAYFRDRVRGNEDTHIIEFDVPKWFDDFMKENAIDQKEYWKNSQNMGGTAPKRVDRTKPGKAYELPPPWNEWLEEYATNARIVR